VSILVWGLVTAAIGFGLLTLVDGRHGLAILVAGTVIMSLGLAPVFTIGNEMIITAAPPQRAGAASAIAETASEFCGALGIAVFGIIGTVIYRQTLADSMSAAAPADAGNTAMATLGGAVAAAQAIPGPVGDALLAASRAAFVGALQFTAALGAFVVVVTSIVSARILRSAGPPGPELSVVTAAPRSSIAPGVAKD